MSTKDLAEMERRKYEKIFRHKNYGVHSQGRGVIDHLINRVKKKKEEPTIVGDFGCARGATFPPLIEAGYIIYPIDHVDVLDNHWKSHPKVVKLRLANLWEDELPRVDYGVCTDVMEHIPTEVVPAVISNIREAVKYGVLWSIAHRKDCWGKIIGETLHMTVRCPSWWRNKLKEVWSTVTVIQSDERNSVYWTE